MPNFSIPLSRFYTTIKPYLLIILTITGVCIGIGLGIGLRSANGERWKPRNAMYLRLPGDLYLRTLSCLMLPLIVASLITAMGSLDLALSRRVGLRALVYYLTTSAMAAVLACAIGHLISPGKKSGDKIEDCEGIGGSTVDTLLDLLRNVFPPNIIGTALQNTRTVVNTANSSIAYEDQSFTIGMVEGTNMLGLIVFALVLGVTLGEIGEVGKPLVRVFASLGSAMLVIARKIIWAAPFAAIFLISGNLVVLEDIGTVFRTLSWYTGVMVGTYLAHGFIVLPILYTILIRRHPFGFIRDIAPAIFSAFATASSSATLPLTLSCLEENHKMDTRITRFLITIGATVNMDGAAIGVPLRVIYIAQLCGKSLTIGEYVTITLTSLAASVGLAGIPGVAMVVTMTILGSMGLPTELIAFVLPVDWLQDRVGTVINVVGDAFGAGIIGHLSRADLARVPHIIENKSNLRRTSDTKDHIDDLKVV